MQTELRGKLSNVPVIDFSKLDRDTELAALDRACRRWGFLQIVNHGVPAHLLDETIGQMRRFFSLPAREKRSIVRTDTNVWGYYDRELTKNRRDWKEIFDVGPPELVGPVAGAEPQWPRQLPDFERTMQAYARACHGIALGLLGAISRNLGLAPDALNEAFIPVDSSFLRINHYPPCEDPAAADSPTVPGSGHLGISHHTDAGALTVLAQDDQPGLQVFADGAWHVVEPRSDALVINIGDIVQVWSNDLYPAPLHRVLASPRHHRYSAPYFFNPAYSYDYAPLAPVCSAENPARYRPINWGEFRAGRAAGDYADRGEEIQIAQFRTGQ